MMGPALFELYTNTGSSSTAERRKRMNTATKDQSDSRFQMSSQSLNSISGDKLCQQLAAVRKQPSPTRQRSSYRLKYVGSSQLARTHTLPMLPWIIADVKRQSLCSEGGGYSAINITFEFSETAIKTVNRTDKQVLLYHKLNNISKFTQTPKDKTWFSYLHREGSDSPFTIHIFQAPDENMVSELFNKMRESRAEILHKQTGQGLQKTRSGSGLETIMTYSNQYEVMYVGSIRMSQKRAHPQVIDDAIDKFRQLDDEKQCKTDTKEDCDHKAEPEPEKAAAPEPQPSTTEERMIIMPNRRFLVKVIEEGSERSTNSVSPTAQTLLSPIDPPVPSISPTPTLGLLLPTTLIANTQSLDAETRVTLLREFRDFQRRTSQSIIDCPDSVFMSGAGGDITEQRKRSISGDNESSPTIQKQLSLPLSRARIGSGGSLDLTRPRPRYQNKTMLFLIGKLELCLISTDKHKVVLNKTFSNISHCSQGVNNADHFGIICREPALNTPESYVIHVFRCQSERLVSEIMHSLKQAFSNAYQSSKNRCSYICDTCPMHWFHRLCCDIEGQSPERAQAIIANRLEGLPGRDRDECQRQAQGVTVCSVHEQNEVFMSALKVICEFKQKKHSHSGGAQERGLFEKRLSVNTLDNLKEKARNSISNTFESLFKAPVVMKPKTSTPRKRSETMDISLLHKIRRRLSRNESSESLMSSPSYSQKSAPNDELSEDDHHPRPRSNTLSEITDLSKDKDDESLHRSRSSHKKPLLNIFMKVGSQSKASVPVLDDVHQNVVCNSSQKSQHRSIGSWRHSIFNRIHLSQNSGSGVEQQKNDSTDTKGATVGKAYELCEMRKPRTKQEVRELWRSAIKQQMILNKMERQNQKIQDDQSSSYDKRMKLDYDEIPNFSDATQLWDAIKTWDAIISDYRHNTTVSYNRVLNAVNLGVPRHKKGEIWLFLADHHKSMCSEECDSVKVDTPYRELLGQLAIQQHSILVDLGRTFPKVPFYAQTLGSGQLSLFNLLKAYSLYDTEVEYCQGLSFVAGILLLHMSEDESFEMMKYILFHRGMRKQYKPDMDALQMQLYQLTRLLYDRKPCLYDHFERHDIAPTLYAAPWFLTLFASQYAIPFVTRLFDLLFLMGNEAIFRVSLVLLDMNSERLLECQCFESIMECLKDGLPSMDVPQMERVFERAFTLDIKRLLDAYEVEYRVIQEELIHVSKPNGKATCEAGGDEIQALTSQLQVCQTDNSHLQYQCDGYLSTIKRLEQRLRCCEDERDALVHSVCGLQARNEKLKAKIRYEANGKTGEDNNNSIDRNSLSSAPVFSISRAEQHAIEAEEEEEEDCLDDEDIDINSDSDDKDCHKVFNRTQSDASNLSI